MKNLLFLLLLPLLFGSCNIDMVQMGHPPKMSDHAYVKLKDGTMIPANNVKAVKKKLKTDSATYRKKNVAEYSNGGKIYTSVCGMLIPQMFSGDING